MAQGFLIPNPRTRFFDSDGAPLSNGWLYGYIAGTSTPQTFYSDSDLSSTHTNPAQLSASGEITIFLPSATLYKFDLYDENLVHQSGWPVDGCEAIPAPDPPAPTPSPVPTGGIIAYGGTSAPSGYLMCDGSLVSRSTYAALFTAIGTAYGAGDGMTTFGVPDLRQRFPLGKATSGTGSTLGGTGGLIDHTHTGPSHTHATTVDWTHTHNVTVAAHAHAMVVAAHSHVLSFPTGSYSTTVVAPSNVGRLVTGDGVTTYQQPNVDRAMTTNDGGAISQDTGSGGAINQSTGAASATSGSFTSAAGGTGATGTANAPFQAVNWIIKT